MPDSSQQYFHALFQLLVLALFVTTATTVANVARRRCRRCNLFVCAGTTLGAVVVSAISNQSQCGYFPHYSLGSIVSVVGMILAVLPTAATVLRGRWRRCATRHKGLGKRGLGKGCSRKGSTRSGTCGLGAAGGHQSHTRANHSSGH